MEEWFSEYDADADYTGGRRLYCLYWVILKLIKLQQHANNAGKHICLKIFFRGQHSLAHWYLGHFSIQINGICYICYFVIFRIVWNLSNEEIFLLILLKCQLFGRSAALLLSNISSECWLLTLKLLKARSCRLALASHHSRLHLSSALTVRCRPDQIQHPGHSGHSHPPGCRLLGVRCWEQTTPATYNLIVRNIFSAVAGSGWAESAGLCNSILFTWRSFEEIFRKIETSYCAALLSQSSFFV